jgi:DNA polymerase I
MPSLRAYLVDLKYSVEENIVVYLYCRTEDKKIVVLRDYYRPNFYVYPKKNQDLVQLRTKIARLRFDDRHFVTSTTMIKKIINCKEDNFIKIFVSNPETVSKVRNTIAPWDSIINCFEEDISLTRRYMLENRIVPFSLFEAEVVDAEPYEGYPSFKVVKFTNRDLSFVLPEVLSVSAGYQEEHKGEKILNYLGLMSEKIEKVITWKDISVNTPHAHKVAGEGEMIDEFRRIVHELKPDFILFEDVNFSLLDIMARAKKYNIHLNINFDYSEPYINPLTGKARTIGLNEVFLRKIIDNFIDFTLADHSLEDIYNTMEGVVNITSSIDEESEENQAMNIAHKKSKISYLLFSSLFPHLTELFKLVGLRGTDLLNFSLNTLVEWILIKACIDTNQIVLNKAKRDDNEEKTNEVDRYKPVIDPVPGIYENIAVVDLTPLYPQIIINNNFSPDTLHCDCCKDICQKTRGIIPTVLIDIVSRTKRIDAALSKEVNDTLSRRKNILTRIMTYFYEYLNHPYSRWYSSDIAEKINEIAKAKINALIEETNEKNSVVYSDYRELCVHLNEDAKSYFEKLKFKFPEASWIKLKGTYKKGLFLPRDEFRQNKKRYCLMDSKNNLTIYNVIRRHSLPAFIIEVLEELVKNILMDKPKSQIMHNFRRRIDSLKSMKVDLKKLLIRHRLTKDLEEYHEKTTQRTIIKALAAKNIHASKGDMIEYIMTDADRPYSQRAALIFDMEGKRYDPEYYLQKLLLPAATEILLLKGITMHDLQDPKGQESLDRFME